MKVGGRIQQILSETGRIWGKWLAKYFSLPLIVAVVTSTMCSLYFLEYNEKIRSLLDNGNGGDFLKIFGWILFGGIRFYFFGFFTHLMNVKEFVSTYFKVSNLWLLVWNFVLFVYGIFSGFFDKVIPFFLNQVVNFLAFCFNAIIAFLPTLGSFTLSLLYWGAYGVWERLFFFAKEAIVFLSFWPANMVISILDKTIG